MRSIDCFEKTLFCINSKLKFYEGEYFIIRMNFHRCNTIHLKHRTYEDVIMLAKWMRNYTELFQCCEMSVSEEYTPYHMGDWIFDLSFLSDGRCIIYS